MRALGGETGRDTLRAINNLAGTVAAQGDLAAARELLQSVISVMIGEYGEQDPDNLAAMGNLAAILWQEGDLAEAYELQRQVVELNRRIHGDADQATLIAAAVLQTMERDTGF
jgi:tetratricopeptide (TPR) repeat protein